MGSPEELLRSTIHRTETALHTLEPKLQILLTIGLRCPSVASGVLVQR
jgi:hypothetical protein